MYRLGILLTVLLLVGCSCLTYVSPTGAKVSYCRLYTKVDTIKATIPGEASIEVKEVVPNDLNKIVKLLDLLK